MSSLSTGPRYRRVAIAIALSVGTIVFHTILCTLLSYSILDLISPHPRINPKWNQKSMNSSSQMTPNFNNSTRNTNNTIPTTTNSTTTNLLNNTTAHNNNSVLSNTENADKIASSKANNSTQTPLILDSPSSNANNDSLTPQFEADEAE